jgi:putative transposase
VTRASDDAAATRVLRAAAVRRLLELDAAEQLTAGHVRLAASSVGLSERTMWRRLGRGRSTGEITPPGRARFVVGEALRRRLAYWRGNVAALHRELAAGAAAGGPPAPAGKPVTRAAARPAASPASPTSLTSLSSRNHQLPGTFKINSR